MNVCGTGVGVGGTGECESARAEFCERTARALKWRGEGDVFSVGVDVEGLVAEGCESVGIIGAIEGCVLKSAA